LVAFYDLWPGNREGLFWFWHFINFWLTYLLRHLRTYLQPRDPSGAHLTTYSCSYDCWSAANKQINQLTRKIMMISASREWSTETQDLRQWWNHRCRQTWLRWSRPCCHMVDNLDKRVFTVWFPVANNNTGHGECSAVLRHLRCTANSNFALPSSSLVGFGRILDSVYGGVHAFSYNSAENEPIWIKSRALWQHCWGWP